MPDDLTTIAYVDDAMEDARRLLESIQRQHIDPAGIPHTIDLALKNIRRAQDRLQGTLL